MANKVWAATGLDFMGLAENIDLDIKNEPYRFEYRNATRGRRATA